MGGSLERALVQHVVDNVAIFCRFLVDLGSKWGSIWSPCGFFSGSLSMFLFEVDLGVIWGSVLY